MAVSFLQQRSAPLASSYMPHGPAGRPAWADLLDEEETPASVVVDTTRRLIKSRSYAGFVPWAELQQLNVKWEEEEASCCGSSESGDAALSSGCSTATPVSASGEASDESEEDSAAPSRDEPSSERWADFATEDCWGPDDAALAITTVMIRNLRVHLTRAKLLQRIDQMGFRGRYDFVHMPMNFGTTTNKRIAFVNFVDAQSAAAFQRAVPSEGRDGGWHVLPAEVQGYEANALASKAHKVNRIRKKMYKPLLCVQRA